MSGSGNETPRSGGGHFVSAAGLRTHYLDVAGGDPPIVILHGLSANASEFGGLIAAGLSPAFRVISPDLRGRGLSDKPATGYTMADHARDVLALIDALSLGRVVLAGHSFGALLAIYIAAHHPERLSKLVVIDAAITMHPEVRELLKPSLDRLTHVLPSADSYLAQLRSASYVAGAWDEHLEGYFRAEIHENADGSAQAVTSAAAIAQALEGVMAEDWRALVGRVRHPVLLLNALGPYGAPGSPPLVPAEHAQETARAFANCRYVEVPGNHLTVVFGSNAVRVVREIEKFVNPSVGR